MGKLKKVAETRLSVRLKGILAEHANLQIENSLYESHSEYIRDLVRKDMLNNLTKESQSFNNIVAETAYESIQKDSYFEAGDDFWNKMSERNKRRQS